MINLKLHESIRIQYNISYSDLCGLIVLLTMAVGIRFITATVSTLSLDQVIIEQSIM